MNAITIHDLSDTALRTLKERAAAHGRSVETEARAVLEAVPPESLPVLEVEGPGAELLNLLRDFWRSGELTEPERAAFGNIRDKAPARDVDFG